LLEFVPSENVFRADISSNNIDEIEFYKAGETA